MAKFEESVALDQLSRFGLSAESRGPQLILMSLVVVVVIVPTWPGIGMGIAIEVLASSKYESTYLPRALEPRVIRFN